MPEKSVVASAGYFYLLLTYICIWSGIEELETELSRASSNKSFSR